MITSRVSEKHRARAIELGVNDYLGKPYKKASCSMPSSRSSTSARRREIVSMSDLRDELYSLLCRWRREIDRTAGLRRGGHRLSGARGNDQCAPWYAASSAGTGAACRWCLSRARSARRCRASPAVRGSWSSTPSAENCSRATSAC